MLKITELTTAISNHSQLWLISLWKLTSPAMNPVIIETTSHPDTQKNPGITKDSTHNPMVVTVKIVLVVRLYAKNMGMIAHNRDSEIIKVVNIT